ncbi:MAG: hypothetical protein ACI9KE_000717 [Polyangiales bacterium]|jgi:hypothetical protein
MKTALFLSLTALLAFACGDDDGAVDANTPLPDASDDVGTDAQADAGNDAGSPDVGVDGGPDGGPDAGPADTYENFAMEFMTTYCVECHGAGNARRDYTTIEDIRRDMVNVRCGVAADPLDDCDGSPAPRQFPIGSGAMPSDEERGRLVAWVEAGLL